MKPTAKKICVVTTGRQDWSILRPICLALENSVDLSLVIVAAGMACDPAFGNIAQHIKKDGFNHLITCDWRANLSSDPSPLQESAAIYQQLPAALYVAQADAVMILGDRYETLQIATICTLLKIPVIHIHGGEETEGAIDNLFRHAITKLSSLHFVSHPLHQQRVLQMGEAPQNVFCVGAPGLDNLCRSDILNKAQLEAVLAHPLPAPLVLVTLHPTTSSNKDSLAECKAMLAAMEEVTATYLITLPNSDPGNQMIRKALEQFASTHTNAIAVNALGDQNYASVLKIADALLGNSSSALIEAPFFATPAVNIGERQKGRLRLSNIIDVPAQKSAIIKGLKKALTPEKRKKLDADKHLLGDGNSAKKIITALKNWPLPSVLQKSFILQQIPDQPTH